MSGTPARNVSPLLIIAAPAGITAVWVLPKNYGWPLERAAIAAVVVFLVVMCLARLPGWLAGGAKRAARATKKLGKKKTDSK
ncbi:hypothetical protein [Streptomyces candidus]|uniref:Small neutral amino acid transporter SnatA (MarC family) n=1 Tax=Streptomyces candidus TaxID=67283 RepID=A0A7X0HL98_9ACTN|nr:hypothetical protein [Streptomyces candidus]MBB6439563.1 small neutral amino acid transporter SnatA (MarC family) [Streptomyces candidus]GHH54580.1 hypothetical protein GCM10018773_57760 [Streptomyces candidus]